MNLEEELQQVVEQLTDALQERARINARIAGLQAQRDSLVAALGPLHVPAAEHADLRGMTKNDAIITVLQTATQPMTIGNIVKALQEAGRDENYNGISVYLQDLLSRGRVHRPARGQYVAV